MTKKFLSESRDDIRRIPSGVLERFQKTGQETGVGLSEMRERVNELGGRLEISSEDHGILVSVTVPISTNRGTVEAFQRVKNC